MKRTLFLLLISLCLFSTTFAEKHRKHAKKHKKHHAKHHKGHELRNARRAKLRLRLEKEGRTEEEIEKLVTADDKKNHKAEFPEGELTKEELDAKKAEESEQGKHKAKHERHQEKHAKHKERHEERNAKHKERHDKDKEAHKELHEKLKKLSDEEKREYIRGYIKKMVAELRGKGLGKEEIRAKLEEFKKNHIEKYHKRKKRHHKRRH